ncbi:hypothetical protein [Delftia phage PhiW-14]|uniref:Uncharacterized protein n=1 Tax=Delftia phage PhiW-14 TaxID=665032 RepID=C9DG56_BPW14|nr:hypothetical protein DP-phiW-14_gp086 [Delftia phage PhiW-14]ACV50107.1 hypothetical protein [Delftia phage PhiW-14]
MSVPVPKPTQQMADGIRNGMQHYVEDMAKAGYIITIETQPQTPLAMGNHKPVVSVRLSNSAYRAKG